MGQKWAQSEKQAKRALRSARILAPEDKAKLTKGDTNMLGHATPKQIDYLADLGVDRSVTVKWTKARASKEISARLHSKASR